MPRGRATAPTDPRPGAELSSLAVELRTAVLRLGRQLRLQDQGELSPTASVTLAVVARIGPATISELAASEHVTLPTMSNVVSRLEEHGFVRRLRDPSDGRISRIEATDAGRRHVEANIARRTEWLTQRLEGLSPAALDDLRAAIDLLRHLGGPPLEPAR